MRKYLFIFLGYNAKIIHEKLNDSDINSLCICNGHNRNKAKGLIKLYDNIVITIWLGENHENISNDQGFSDICKFAKKLNKNVEAIVIMPFLYYGKNRCRIASEALMEAYYDKLILFNQKLFLKYLDCCCVDVNEEINKIMSNFLKKYINNINKERITDKRILDSLIRKNFNID